MSTSSYIEKQVRAKMMYGSLQGEWHCPGNNLYEEQGQAIRWH